MGKWYTIDYNRAFNIPFQSSAAYESNKGLAAFLDTVQRETDELVKKYYADCDALAYGRGKKTETEVFYTLITGKPGIDTSYTYAHYTSEADAIRDAEARAKASPGLAVFVMKAVAKSYVEKTPAITTRL